MSCITRTVAVPQHGTAGAETLWTPLSVCQRPRESASGVAASGMRALGGRQIAQVDLGLKCQVIGGPGGECMDFGVKD